MANSNANIHAKINDATIAVSTDDASASPADAVTLDVEPENILDLDDPTTNDVDVGAVLEGEDSTFGISATLDAVEDNVQADLGVVGASEENSVVSELSAELSEGTSTVDAAGMLDAEDMDVEHDVAGVLEDESVDLDGGASAVTDEIEGALDVDLSETDRVTDAAADLDVTGEDLALDVDLSAIDDCSDVSETTSSVAAGVGAVLGDEDLGLDAEAEDGEDGLDTDVSLDEIGGDDLLDLDATGDECFDELEALLDIELASCGL